MQPIILIGAARSGTKFLRAIIASSRAIRAVPYDINYIWRYGNEHCSHDALPASCTTAKTSEFICRYVQGFASRGVSGPCDVVEKTVSNALRIPFVYRTMPNARFVFLLRDGRDVTASAIRCWRRPPRATYLAKKAISFPWFYCTGYATRHLLRSARSLLGLETASRSWGPRYPGLDEDLRNHGLLYVCAKQWQTCVDHYFESHTTIPSDSRITIRYEELVRSPYMTGLALAKWLKLPDCSEVASFAEAAARKPGQGIPSALSREESEYISAILAPTLKAGQFEQYPLRAAA